MVRLRPRHGGNDALSLKHYVRRSSFTSAEKGKRATGLCLSGWAMKMVAMPCPILINPAADQLRLRCILTSVRREHASSAPLDATPSSGRVIGWIAAKGSASCAVKARPCRIVRARVRCRDIGGRSVPSGIDGDPLFSQQPIHPRARSNSERKLCGSKER